MLFETPAATTTGGGRSVATLEDYLEAIKNRKLWVVAGVVLGLGASIFLTKGNVETYESSAQVLLNPSPAGRTDGGLTAPNLEREAKVIVGETITDDALAKLSAAEASDPGSASASFTPQSDVITVTASSPLPQTAADLANAYTTIYVEQRVAEQKTVFEALTSGVQKDIDTFNASIAGAQLQVGDLDQQIADLRKLTPGTDRDNRITDLTTQRAAALGQVATTQSFLNQAQVKLSDLQRSQNGALPAAKILTEARPPDSPVGLSRKVYVMGGLLGGLLLGIIAAFLRERLDRKASGPREIELALGGRVIGSVPRFSFLYRRGQWALVMANGKTGVSLQRAREAYRRLRASMLFLARTDDVRTIVVSSTKPREGKSTTSANLALALALGGTRTALVSADLRKPSLEGLFGIRNDRGLSTYLTGKTDTVHTETIEGIEALTIIPAGPEIPNPGELLGSPRFARLVELLAAEFDMVIIDSPPLGAAADSLAAAESADGVLVVVDGSRTDTNELFAIRRELDRAGAKLVGAVLNREAVKFKLPFRGRGYGYYGTDGGGARSGIALDDESASPVLANPSGRQSVGRRAEDVARRAAEDVARRADAQVPGQPPTPRRTRREEPAAEIPVAEERFAEFDEVDEVEEIETVDDALVVNADEFDDEIEEPNLEAAADEESASVGLEQHDEPFDLTDDDVEVESASSSTTPTASTAKGGPNRRLAGAGRPTPAARRRRA